MEPGFEATALVSGLATGVGSLPHTDARLAARRSLELTPRLPAAPQLPQRDPRELMLAQWLFALPEVTCAPDGTLTLGPGGTGADAPIVPRFDRDHHGGLLEFLDVAARVPSPPARITVQLTGPITLGLALMDLGVPRARAFERGGEVVRSWIPELERLVRAALPDTALLCFLDEPGLVAFSNDDSPIDHEDAVDLLSGALARVTGLSGVHVCGTGNVRVALEAGPRVLGLEAGPRALRDATALVRHLDSGGWIAWGAVPTDRPIGEIIDPLWKSLAALWCEFTKLGADPVALRSQAIITPACGLGSHGEPQAEHALALAKELAVRVHDQALAARLTLGA